MTSVVRPRYDRPDHPHVRGVSVAEPAGRLGPEAELIQPPHEAESQVFVLAPCGPRSDHRLVLDTVPTWPLPSDCPPLCPLRLHGSVPGSWSSPLFSPSLGSFAHTCGPAAPSQDARPLLSDPRSRRMRPVQACAHQSPPKRPSLSCSTEDPAADSAAGTPLRGVFCNVASAGAEKDSSRIRI